MSKTFIQPLHPIDFDPMAAGQKAYEVTIDVGYSVGDWFQYQRSDTEDSGQQFWARVTHKTEGGTRGLPEGLCVLGLALPETWTLRKLIQTICTDVAADETADVRLDVERYFHDRGRSMLQPEAEYKRELLALRQKIKQAIRAAVEAGDLDSWRQRLAEAEPG